jgi:hypothetical protein
MMTQQLEFFDPNNDVKVSSQRIAKEARKIFQQEGRNWVDVIYTTVDSHGK